MLCDMVCYAMLCYAVLPNVQSAGRLMPVTHKFKQKGQECAGGGGDGAATSDHANPYTTLLYIFISLRGAMWW